MITHGTMCLVRRSALEPVAAGARNDPRGHRAGLRLYEAGFQALYTNYRTAGGWCRTPSRRSRRSVSAGRRGDGDHSQALDDMLPGARTLTRRRSSTSFRGGRCGSPTRCGDARLDFST